MGVGIIDAEKDFRYESDFIIGMWLFYRLMKESVDKRAFTGV